MASHLEDEGQDFAAADTGGHEQRQLLRTPPRALQCDREEVAHLRAVKQWRIGTGGRRAFVYSTRECLSDSMCIGVCGRECLVVM